MTLVVQDSPRGVIPRGELMLTPDDVSAMTKLRELGWGVKRIAAELGCSRSTVRRWLAIGGWQGFAKPRRARALDGLELWLRERLLRHAGNADVVRQELAAELGIVVSLRTVERAVAPMRRELAAAARATVRFETRPGEQLQIDFGERQVAIGEETVRAHLFVATLGYSRRLHVRAYRHERQESWFDGLESALRAFGGVPEEVLLDNARALIVHHDPASREVVLHPRLHAFARHFGFRVRACAPYRARTKGKDERGVGYVKRNAIAGRRFASWGGFEAHLAAWTREIADLRVHGSTGEPPIERFRRAEAAALRPLAGIAPFTTSRELIRRVGNDCAVEVDGNAYSVPWRLIGEHVRAIVGADTVRVLHGGQEVAAHRRLGGRHGRAVDPAHFAGVAGSRGHPVRVAPATAMAAGLLEPAAAVPAAALLRPLSEYEAAIGGGF